MEIELLLIAECAHGDTARQLIRTALSDLHMAAPVRTTTIETDSEATHRGFTGSPTILIDGRDPFARPSAQPGVACRVYATPEGLRGVPDIGDLRRALKEAADARGLN